MTKNRKTKKPGTAKLIAVTALTEGDEARLSSAKPEILKAYGDGGMSHFTTGGLLRAAKAELKDRVFCAWMDAELPFTARHGQNFMRIDEMLGKNAEVLCKLQLTSLIALARKDLSAASRAAIIRDIAAGKITKDIAVLKRISETPEMRAVRDKATAVRAQKESKRNDAVLEIAVTVVESLGDQLADFLPKLRLAGFTELADAIGTLTEVPETEGQDEDSDLRAAELFDDSNGKLTATA